MSDRELFIEETAREDQPLPIGYANHAFVLAYDRGRWTARPDGAIVPDLFPLSLQPGQLGIGESIRGDMARIWAKVKEQTIGRSYRPLTPNITVEGRRPIRSVQVRDSASKQEVTMWAPAWETFTNHTERRGWDCALHDAFLAEWRRVENIPARPDDDVIDSRISVLRNICERAAAKPGGKETERYKVHAAEMAVWEALRSKGGETAPDAEELNVPEDEPAAPAAKVKRPRIAPVPPQADSPFKEV